MADTANRHEVRPRPVKARTGIREFRLDPIPGDTIDEILEVARWAMSGANSQPWEFMVVADPKIKCQLRDAYSEHSTDFIFWMEQQREYKLRHRSCEEVTPDVYSLPGGGGSRAFFVARRQGRGKIGV